MFLGKQIYKRSSVFSSHLSRTPVARRLKRYNPETGRAALSFPYLILLQVGFTEPDSRLSAGELLPRLSTLTFQRKAVSFCGTRLRVAPTGRYPAPCPMELRLSSEMKNHPRDCPIYLLPYYNFYLSKRKERKCLFNKISIFTCKQGLFALK